MLKKIFISLLFIFAVSCADVATDQAGDSIVDTTGSLTGNGGGNVVVAGPQGTYNSPYVVNNLPFSGASGSVYEMSYYEVTGLTTGHNYQFSLTGIALDQDYDLYVYPNINYTPLGCNSVSGGNGISEQCIAPVSGGSGTTSMYVWVLSWTSGGTFTLNATDMGPIPVNQGTNTAAGAYAITAVQLPFYGSVGAWGSSYYAVSGLAPDRFYKIDLTGLTNNASLYFYDTNGNFNGISCSSLNAGIADESCTAILSASVVGGNPAYIKVTSSGSAGTFFNLNLTDMGPAPVNQGTIGGPVAVTALTQLPYTGSVAPWGASYYSVKNLNQGHSYTVNLTNLTQNADLFYYDRDGTFTSVGCQSNNTGLFDESCTASVTPSNIAGNPVYVKITSNAASGTFYSLNFVDNGIVNVDQGTASNPVILDVSQLPFIPATVSTGGMSYYGITGLIPGNQYAFNITALSQNADMNFYYTDSSFGAVYPPECVSANPGIADESCSRVILGATTTVYFSVNGGPITSGTGTQFMISMTDNGSRLMAQALPVTISFDALSTLPADFYFSGNAPWVIDNVNGGGQGTAKSMASGTITHSQTSCAMVYVRNLTPGSVDFDWRTDSESSRDWLNFSVNGMGMYTVAGQWGWFTLSGSIGPIPLSVGVNELKWCYDKDNIITVGLDKVWVDTIVIN